MLSGDPANSFCKAAVAGTGDCMVGIIPDGTTVGTMAPCSEAGSTCQVNGTKMSCAPAKTAGTACTKATVNDCQSDLICEGAPASTDGVCKIAHGDGCVMAEASNCATGSTCQTGAPPRTAAVIDGTCKLNAGQPCMTGPDDGCVSSATCEAPTAVKTDTSIAGFCNLKGGETCSTVAGTEDDLPCLNTKLTCDTITGKCALVKG